MNKNKELLLGTDKWFVLNYDASYNCVVLDFLGRIKCSYILTDKYNEAVAKARHNDEEDPDNRKFPLKKSDAFCLFRQKSSRLFELKHISELKDSDEIEDDTIYESVSVVVIHASNLSTIKFENPEEEIQYYYDMRKVAETMVDKATIIENSIASKHPNGERSYTCGTVVDIAGHGLLASVSFMSLGNKFDRTKVKRNKPEYTDESRELINDVERGFSFGIDEINLN